MEPRRFGARALKRFAASSLLGLATCSLTAPSVAQQVSPFQTGHYTVGFMNIRDLSRPEPGSYALLYSYLGMSGAYYDAEGQRLSEIPVADRALDVEVSVQAMALAFNYTWVFEVIGDLRYLGFVVPTLTGGNASVTVAADGTGRTAGGGLFGVGDLMLAPLYLSWGNDWFDVTGGYGLYAPVGKYEAGADDNVGRGHWTNQFQLAGYLYLLEKASALMASITYEIPTEIVGTAVTPGQRLSVEYGLSQYATEWMELGVFGGHNLQLTSDHGAGVDWHVSDHDRKSIAGGQLGVWVTDWAQVIMRLGSEYGARQRFAGTTAQLNAIFVLGPEPPTTE